MSYDIGKVKDILKSVFSDIGYKTSTISFKCPSPVGVSIANLKEGISIDFLNTKNLYEFSSACHKIDASNRNFGAPARPKPPNPRK